MDLIKRNQLDYIKNYFSKPSYRLLFSLSVEKDSISFQDLCFSCFGIQVDSIECKHCNVSYCIACFELLNKSTIFCYCFRPKIGDFIRKERDKFKNTYNFIQKGIKNEKSKSEYHDSIAPIFPTLFVGLTVLFEGSRNDISQIFNKKDKIPNHFLLITNHLQSFNHQLEAKNIRMINFLFAKGYKLELKQKTLCYFDCRSLKKIRLSKFLIFKCNLGLDFAIYFSKIIMNNKRRLEGIVIKELIRTHPKASLVLEKAISACLNLQELCLRMANLNPQILEEGEKISKDGYIFINLMYRLRVLTITHQYFDASFNYSSFRSLKSLKKLDLIKCKFNHEAFMDVFEKLNVSSLMHLYFDRNWIIGYFNEVNSNKLLTIVMQLKQIKILEIQLVEIFTSNLKPILNSFLSMMLNTNSLEELILGNYSLNNESPLIEKLSLYLKQTTSLKKIKWSTDKMTYPKVYESLFRNLNLEEISLMHFCLKGYEKEIEYFLIHSKKIRILKMNFCTLDVSYNLINSAMLNKNLNLLDLENSLISDIVLSKLNKSCLSKVALNKYYKVKILAKSGNPKKKINFEI